MDRLADSTATIAETKETNKPAEMADIVNDSVVPVSTTITNQPIRESHFNANREC